MDAASNADIEQDPKTLAALLRLGFWRFEQERYEDAETLFSKVLELNRQSGRPIDSELESVNWKIRLTLQRTGKWPWQPKWESKFVGARLGEPATLSVQPIEGEWDYQWYCNDEPVEGATDPTLTLSNVTVDQLGTYQVKLAPPGYESVIFQLAGDAISTTRLVQSFLARCSARSSTTSGARRLRTSRLPSSTKTKDGITPDH